jgi:hypothetical protein
MATPFTDTVDRVVTLFRTTFENAVILRREERPNLALVEMSGDYGIYQVCLREIWRDDGSRKYSYYVLHRSKVVVGFDNASDPRALRLKYGGDYTQHRLELTPHRHTEGKETLELTDEINCAAFIAWLKEHLPP